MVDFYLTEILVGDAVVAWATNSDVLCTKLVSSYLVLPHKIRQKWCLFTVPKGSSARRKLMTQLLWSRSILNLPL